MSLPVPDQINHRRRVVYRALTEVLQDDPRVPELFALLDGVVVKDSQFLASKLVDEAVWMGLLSDTERTPLTRAIIRNMSLPYEQLPKYPPDLVLRTVQGNITNDTPPPIPSLTQTHFPEQSLTRDSVFLNASAKYEIANLPDHDSEREAAPELLQYCANRVFLMVASRFIKYVQEVRPVSLGRLLIYKALQTHQDRLASQILQPWDRSKLHIRALPSDISLEDMKSIVKLLQLTASDIIGSEMSQELIERSLRDAQKMQEAIEYPPQNLFA